MIFELMNLHLGHFSGFAKYVENFNWCSMVAVILGSVELITNSETSYARLFLFELLVADFEFIYHY